MSSRRREALRESFSRLSETCPDLAAVFADAESAVEALDTEAAALAASAASLAELLAAVRNALDDAATVDTEARESLREAWVVHVTELMEEIDDKDTRIYELERQVEEQGSRIDELEAEIAELELRGE